MAVLGAQTRDTPAGEIGVQVAGPRALRVRFFGPPPAPEARYVVATLPDPPPGPAGVPDSDGRWTVRAEHGAVELDVADPAVPRLAFFDAGGRRVLATPRDGIGLDRVVERTGGRERCRAWLRLQRDRRGPEDDAHFYGLGEGGGAVLDRLGLARHFWNVQIGHGPGADLGIPLLVAISPGGAYGLFFDTTAEARLETARGRGGLTLAYEAEASSFDLYFLAGPTPPDVLAEYTRLTGRPALPPRWSLGYLQSTRFFEHAEQIVALARQFREKRFPCDALIFLSTYGEFQGWNAGVGHLAFHPRLWSDPAGLMRQLRDELRFRIVTHEYPVVHPASPAFEEAERRGFLLDVAYPAAPPSVVAADSTNTPQVQRYAEDQRYLDFSNPAARTWWWEQHRHLVDLGVDGWWLDGGEGPPAISRLHLGDGTLLHNTFDLLRARSFAEGEARDRPDQRPWMLCRSGAAGMQRLGAFSWTGDNNCTFTTLEQQIPIGLNLAMSGVPFWGTDIGGFFPAALDGELYARWFQFGAFCPLFRSHGWDARRHTPFAHGPEVEAICRRYAELRMRLLPYVYALAWRASTHGEPLMRPLVYHYPDDPNVWELGSQYLFGPDLLVAPVTRAAVREWPVYLPAGHWYDFWTGERFEGGRFVAAAAPLDRLPLFARGGSIIPLGPIVERADDRPLDDLTLLVYPPGAGGGGAGQIYEDDGRTRGSPSAVTEVACRVDGESTRIEVGPARGPYGGGADWRDVTVRVWVEQPPREIHAERGGRAVDLAPRSAGAAGAAPTWWFEEPSSCWVAVPAVGRTEPLSIQLRG